MILDNKHYLSKDLLDELDSRGVELQLEKLKENYFRQVGVAFSLSWSMGLSYCAEVEDSIMLNKLEAGDFDPIAREILDNLVPKQGKGK